MRYGLVAAMLLVGLALVTPAAAGEPTDTLRRLFEQANRILSASDVTDDARLASLRALVHEAFDTRAAAALALGHEWAVRTAAERDEFSRLYGDVIEGAYLGGVGSRARLRGDGIRVAFASESVQGTSASVLTTLETRAGAVVPVEYRLRRDNAGWAVVDVVVEGLSLAASYRAQIQRVMQNGTWADVVARLREKASTATLAAIAAAKAAAAVVPRPASPTFAPRVEPSPAAEAEWARPPAVAEIPVGPAAPPPPKSIWIQVGAFRDPDAASRLMERLRNYSVATGRRRSDSLTRVLVGPFTTRAAAGLTLRTLLGDGYRGFIAVE